MTGNELMVYGSAGEVRIVAAHAHQLIVFFHGIGGVGDAEHFATGKEWIDELALGCHHDHPPGLFCHGWNGDQVIFFEEVDRFVIELHDRFRLFAGRYVGILYFFKRFFSL